jgi:predicted DNA-binding ribbon-helix-helix protein
MVKRSLVIGRQRISVSLEDMFWAELSAIAEERGLRVSELVEAIASERSHSNLTSAIRVFVLECVARLHNIHDE